MVFSKGKIIGLVVGLLILLTSALVMLWMVFAPQLTKKYDVSTIEKAHNVYSQKYKGILDYQCSPRVEYFKQDSQKYKQGSVGLFSCFLKNNDHNDVESNRILIVEAFSKKQDNLEKNLKKTQTDYRKLDNNVFVIFKGIKEQDIYDNFRIDKINQLFDRNKVLKVLDTNLKQSLEKERINNLTNKQILKELNSMTVK